LKSTKSIFLLKSLFVVVLMGYLVYKIFASSILDSIHEIKMIKLELIVFTLLLMILNWGLETKKWQVLLQNVQELSFINAFKSVLAGLSSGLLTTNRIGNFIGRLAYVNKENHNQATVNTLVGNLAQFISTILMGVIGFSFLLLLKFDVQNYIWICVLSIFFFSLACYVYFKPSVINFMPLNKLFGDQTKLSIQEINDSSTNLKVKVLGLSVVRYIVFCIQYFLLFKAFGLEISTIVLFSLITTVFLLTTLIPSLLFGKLFVRESVAVFVFSLVSIDLSLILLVAFLLWIINLAIPALIGSVFWLKQSRYA